MNDMDFISQLDGLIDCEFEVTNPATTGLSVQISVATTGIGVSGAVAPSTVVGSETDGDLIILNSATAVEIPITSLTESTTKGLYAVLGTFVAETSYTIGFREPSEMALEGYDTYAVATFTIPA